MPSRYRITMMFLFTMVLLVAASGLSYASMPFSINQWDQPASDGDHNDLNHSLTEGGNNAIIHYRRCDEAYGDASSSDFNEFWGLHVWEDTTESVTWDNPLRPTGSDSYGIYFQVGLKENAEKIGYIIHKGDQKDPASDLLLNFAETGYEIWQVQDDNGNQYTSEAAALAVVSQSCSNQGNISQQGAYWVTQNTIAWQPRTAGATSYKLHYASNGGMQLAKNTITGSSSLDLSLNTDGLSSAITSKFPHLASLSALTFNNDDLSQVAEILKGQIAVAAYDQNGNLIDTTGLQIPGVLDDLYASPAADESLGVNFNNGAPTVSVWAPTAKSVTLHLFDDSNLATKSMTQPMTVESATGIWSLSGDTSWQNKFYLYEVEVYVHSTGQVERNLVTDPYAISLSMNSQRSQIVDLNDTTLKPSAWDSLTKPDLAAPEDITLYELHMRDFSVNDGSVPADHKGKFSAFTLPDSNGMTHLKKLANAGLTHIHLLPLFDIATINENVSERQEVNWGLLNSYRPYSEEQQAAITAIEDQDAFNWGYDPYHYTVPEGSYSSNPDGATRILEFRQMVQALSESGLRVVMDVVYNHTNSSGQSARSVLDKVVPGYYHRLDDKGQVTNSTCCHNTATEHAMMEKLMIDSLKIWATEYKVDGFRFDLMGHHMVSNMQNVKNALTALTEEADGVDGSSIYLYGEGWNFGEVADGARGENATQLHVGGLGIGTFNDRIRDAARGGGPFDEGSNLKLQGFINGLGYDANDLNQGDANGKLLLHMDQIRVGLAANLADYSLIDRTGNTVTGAQVDYNGAPTGYTQDPQEHIIYVSAHDNQTLFDVIQYKAPLSATTAERARMQNMGLSLVCFSQGVPFFHAGSEMLRSKSLDRDSYNSADWFNRLDFTYQKNNWGAGLPVASKNENDWPIMTPLLSNAALTPTTDDIQASVNHLQECLKIRQSSAHFRLQTASQVKERVNFHNTGPNQTPGLIVMSIKGDSEMAVVLFNANDEAQTHQVDTLVGLNYSLHAIQASSSDEIVKTSSFDNQTGTFTIPARTTAVFMGPLPAHLLYLPLVLD